METTDMSFLHNQVLISIFAMTLATATPLILSAIGELMTQRAGIWNLGVEGTMLAAAFTAYGVVLATGSLLLATLAAMAAAALVGALTAALTAGLKLDHFVIGLTINLIASGLTLYLFRASGTDLDTSGLASFSPVAIPWLSQIPFLGPVLFDQPLLTYLALALIPGAWLFLYRTRAGLELRVLGENPRVLETRGIAVMPRLWLATIAGSAMTGLGGAFLMLDLAGRFTPDMSAGRGWLVVVALVAGNWTIAGTMAAILCFALLDAVASFGQVMSLPVPYEFLLALPYLASIMILTIFRSRSGQPAQLGIPYSRK
jgi:simple sugar transport system permease protein